MDHREEPCLQVGGLSIWVHGYPTRGGEEDRTDPWILITARCCAPGAMVEVSGEILQLMDLIGFGECCQRIHAGELRSAIIEPLEPWLNVEIVKSDNLGHLDLKVEITPEYMSQEHCFHFGIDQSYLPGIATQCARIGMRFK